MTSLGGGLATEIGPWYYSLSQPEWKPPNWLFGPVWTSIYALMVYAGLRVWRRAGASSRRLFIALLACNLVVNLAWSLLFFRLQRPDWSLYEMPLLWGSILALVVLFWRTDRRAGLVALPYLIWVSFAATLNFTIVQLNAPFGS